MAWTAHSFTAPLPPCPSCASSLSELSDMWGAFYACDACGYEIDVSETDQEVWQPGRSESRSLPTAGGWTRVAAWKGEGYARVPAKHLVRPGPRNG